MLYIVWVWPSISDHQDDITCLIGDPELNLHLPLLLGGHTQDIVMFGLELVYQFGMRVTPKNRIEGILGGDATTSSSKDCWGGTRVII